jgi:hypothetical protein
VSYLKTLLSSILPETNVPLHIIGFLEGIYSVWAASSQSDSNSLANVVYIPLVFGKSKSGDKKVAFE